MEWMFVIPPYLGIGSRLTSRQPPGRGKTGIRKLWSFRSQRLIHAFFARGALYDERERPCVAMCLVPQRHGTGMYEHGAGFYERD